MFGLSSVEFNLLQLMFSACVAAVKCRIVLHNCEVLFFWSSDCMLFTFESSAQALGSASGVASVITTDEQLR